MSEKPARAAKAPSAAKRAKPAKTSKPARASKPAAAPAGAGSRPTHDEIADRAYYIHLHEGESDPLLNWLRAERELSAG